MVDLSQVNKDYRLIGDVSYAVFEQELKRVNSPMLATAKATYVAAQPMTALFLAQSRFENRHETTGLIVHPGDHNPVTLRPWLDGNGHPCDPRTKGGLPPGATGIITAPDGSHYLKFGSDAACAAEWKHRLTDPSYKAGVYTKAHALKDMLDIYCPPGDKHAITGEDANAGYDPAVMTTLRQFAAAEGGTPPGESTVANLNMTKGLIPLPAYTKHYIDVSRRNQSIGCRGYDDLGWRTVNGLVLHRSQGTFRSNVNWFEATCCPALTDWQIDPNTGEMMQFVPTVTRISGWANGSVRDPYGDGKAFVQKYGIDAVNRDQQSCEIAGNFNDPISARAWQNLAQWAAHFAHDKGITYEQWPIVPEDGFSWVRWHDEVAGPTSTGCPGPVVKDGTPDWIEMVRAILKVAQTSGVLTPQPPAPKPVKYVVPKIPAGLPNLATLDPDKALPDYQDKEGRNYETVFDIYEATEDTHRYSHADGRASSIINDPFPKGGRAVIAIRFDSNTTKDKPKWGMTREGSRLWLDKAFKRVSDASVLS